MHRVSIGFATILGTVAAAAAAIAPLVGELANAAQPLGVPPQTWVIVSAVLATAVVLGRMAQAVAGPARDVHAPESPDGGYPITTEDPGEMTADQEV